MIPLGEIERVIEEDLSEDRMIMVNSVETYEVIPESGWGRIKPPYTHQVQDCGLEGEGSHDTLIGGQLGADEGGRNRPEFGRSDQHRAPIH